MLSKMPLACYANALLWARTEGFIPAPETSHAITGVINEAKKAKEEGKEKTILLCWSGHGLMDLKGYEAYMNGALSDYALPEEQIVAALDVLKDYPKL